MASFVDLVQGRLCNICWGTCASSQLKGVLRPGIIVGDIHDSQDTYCAETLIWLPTLKFQIECVSQNKLNSASPEAGEDED